MKVENKIGKNRGKMGILERNNWLQLLVGSVHLMFKSAKAKLVSFEWGIRLG